MKIVIDISDIGYDWIKNGFPDNEDKEFLIRAIANGTVLPKGHGDLVERKCKNKICRDCAYADVCYRLDASIIIPADKGE